MVSMCSFGKTHGVCLASTGMCLCAVLGVRQREAAVLSTPTSPSVTLYCLKFCLQNSFEAKRNLENRGKWLFPFLALFTAHASVFSVPSRLCTLSTPLPRVGKHLWEGLDQCFSTFLML